MFLAGWRTSGGRWKKDLDAVWKAQMFFFFAEKQKKQVED